MERTKKLPWNVWRLRPVGEMGGGENEREEIVTCKRHIMYMYTSCT